MLSWLKNYCYRFLHTQLFSYHSKAFRTLGGGGGLCSYVTRRIWHRIGHSSTLIGSQGIITVYSCVRIRPVSCVLCECVGGSRANASSEFVQPRVNFTYFVLDVSECVNSLKQNIHTKHSRVTSTTDLSRAWNNSRSARNCLWSAEKQNYQSPLTIVSKACLPVQLKYK